jgi:tetratricopeptide (TPR) repeat protein
MKSTIKVVIFIFALLVLLASVHAQTPREQLSQLVAQLQKTPSDGVLREKIIELGTEMKPAPAIPEEVERRMARGTAAFKGSKSAADYQDAIKEFDLAVAAAPWYADAYFNLGVAQDKAERYAEALQNLKWAQMASPDSKDIKALLYEVEYRNEKFNSREAQTAREQAANEKARNEMALRFVGLWRHDFQLSGYDRSVFLVMRVGPDGKLQIARDPEKPFEPDPAISEISISGDEVRYKSRYTGLDFKPHLCHL